jgi:beta-lactamase class A
MRYVLAVLLALLAAQPAWAQDDTGLDAQLRALTAGYGGHVALYATDLKTGETAALNADTPVPTASVIKLTVLFEALKQIQSGRAHFDDKLVMQKSDQVEGSGVLTLFDTPMPLTLKDALTMMIVVSDNTGTNLTIDHLGLQNINNRIKWLGLHDTWLYKKVFLPPVGPVPPDQPQFGLGKTTAREMASVMQRFATCNLNAPGVTAAPSPSDRKLCDAALSMLKNQQDRESIPRYLSAEVANKTGSLNDVRNDVAIVYAKNGPVIISGFTYDNKDHRWTADNSAQVLLGKLAQAIVAHWH